MDKCIRIELFVVDIRIDIEYKRMVNPHESNHNRFFFDNTNGIGT